jgi:inosine/xanthosine triphosphate pyrophosphatase family protein
MLWKASQAFIPPATRAKRPDDIANVAKLPGRFESVPDEERTARFKTVIAVAYPDGSWFVVDGELEGSIARAPVGQGGGSATTRSPG